MLVADPVCQTRITEQTFYRWKTKYQGLESDQVWDLKQAQDENVHWFLSLADAHGKLESWRRDYNEVRPRSAIGNKPPIMLTNQGSITSPLP